MKEYITVLGVKDAIKNTKVPLSPFGDRTFNFGTYEVLNHKDFYKIMVQNFILNIPLKEKLTPFRSRRSKTELSQFQSNLTYVILDIDKVKSAKSRDFILDYFRPFKCILGASRSHDGISNFRLKGVLFTEEIPAEHARTALSVIHHDLREHCEIDESSVRSVSYNAPILKTDIFINNEDAPRWKYDKANAKERIQEIKNLYNLSDVSETVQYSLDDINNIEADSIESLCLQSFQTMGFEAIKSENGCITFKHFSEKKSIGGYFWFSGSPYTMHHFNTTKTINIFENIIKLDQAKELLKKEINYDDELLKFDTRTKVTNVNSQYLEVNKEIDSKIKSFLNTKDGLFSIKSPMGTGKSTIIGHIIEECHEEDLRVLIITNRISVAQDFGKKYDLKVYNQDKYEFNDSLVCQYDSLWKYDIRNFDVIIMDEFISLMLHSRNNLSNSSVNIAKFFATFNKKLVIADAFLTGYENFLLKHKSELFLVNNEYRDTTKLFDYENFNFFVQSIITKADFILDVIDERKNNPDLIVPKMTISCTSLSFLNELNLLLSQRGLKVITLTASTPDSTKELIYDLFEQEHHDKFDVLIFSPTLTVGVSNLNNVKWHYHYDSSMSTDVISSIQMIKRSRRTEEIHIHVKSRISFLRTSYNELRDDYMNNLGKNIEHNYLFDIDDYGSPRLSRTGTKALRIDVFRNILEFNHKEAFNYLIKYHFSDVAKNVPNTFAHNALSKYKREIKADSKLLLNKEIEEFLELNEIERLNIAYKQSTSLRSLLAIDERIRTKDPEIKRKILINGTKDSSFITKCLYYKALVNFTSDVFDITDINSLVHNAVLNNEHDDIKFYNSLIKYGNNPIKDEYTPKLFNQDRLLKYLLTKSGYKMTSSQRIKSIGNRNYVVDPAVKKLHMYIK